MIPVAPPLSQRMRIRSVDDVRALEHVPLAETLQARSTYELLRNAAAAFGDKTALALLVDADPDTPPLRLSYAQLLREVHRTANLLARLGLGPHDVVAMLLPACLESHLALWGGAAAGVVQPLNPLLSDDKLAALMIAAGAKALVAWGAAGEADYWAKAMRLRERVPTLAHVLRVAPAGESGAANAPWPAGVIDFAEARSREPDDRLVSGREIDRADVAALFHTGGTTGSPKLARHSHGAQVFTAWACVQMQGTGPADVLINAFPLFHVAGVLPGALTALAAGATTIIPTTTLLRNRDVVANYWRLVERHRATVLSGVPTMLAALAQVPLGDADISSIRFCRTGAAALPPELSARFEREFGLHVHESLGMTETAGITTVTPPGVIGPPGCVGFALPHARLRVAALDADGRPTDRELPAGGRGMVLYQGPNVFSGFVDPADDAGVFTADGWLVTGDLGWIDGDGRLNLCGRAKDLIIRSGHNIDPRVIEDALDAHPAVLLSAAVGAPDAYAGELPVAFAQLRPGHAATEAELLAFVAARVDEAPARPRRVRVVERIPTTNVGKIYKPALRALAAFDVVADVVAATCERAGTARARLDGERVVVVIDAQAPDAAQLRSALRDALAPLPWPVALESPGA